MTGALLGAQRAGEVVIGEGDIGAVLSIQSHLKEVRKGAAVTVGASRAVGANGSGVNEVVAGGVLTKSGNSGVAIDAFRCIDVPLRPAIRSSVSASRLHCGDVVGITGQVCPEPGHYDVAVCVCGYPRKHIRFAYRSTAVHAHGSTPRVSQTRGRGQEHILVIGPHGVDVAETIDRKGREDVVVSVGGALRTHGAGENFMVREGESWRAQSWIRGNSNIHTALRSAADILLRVSRSGEPDVKVSFARARAVVHFDLRYGVSAAGRRQAARRRKSRCINGFAQASRISQAAVVRALHVDVERRDVVIGDI